MVKRSITKTKSKKTFMNPTDQWRKESRLKELRKNKMQRDAVRGAVLKAKDPKRILKEIEEIHKIEVDAGPVPLPNDKSLKEKKRKLEETLHRIVSHFKRRDPTKAGNIKQLMAQSESKRRNMAKVFRDYQTASSQISLSDIPLPGEGLTESLDRIPLPGAMAGGPVPPPPPPGPPPKDMYAPFKLAEDNDDGDEHMDSEEGSGSEAEDDSEEESGEKESKRFRTVKFVDAPGEGASQPPEPSKRKPPGPPPGLPGMPPGPPPGIPPPIMRPPPPPSGLPPHFSFGGPPGPPAGPPPPQIMRYPIPPRMAPPTGIRPHINSPTIILAPPTMAAPSVKNPEAEPPQPPPPTKESATISAQPQLRNIKAQVTKFMPTSLRVRRETPKNMKPKVKQPNPSLTGSSVSVLHTSSASKQGPLMGQGDAYDSFMREMTELI